MRLMLLLAGSLAAADPVYVTAFRDPCRAVEAHRLAAATAAIEPLTVTGPDGASRQVPAVAVAVPGTGHVLHRAIVDGLAPGTAYTLRFAADEAFRIRTVPLDPPRPLRIATGGDTMHEPAWFTATTRVLAARDPDLVVIGGDLAYEDGKRGERVLTWIRTWHADARAPDGRVLTFVAGIGNHEVDGAYGKTPAEAPYFFAMFPLEGRAYQAVDVGTRLSFLLLDTDHATRIPGAQTEWLESALAERRGRTVIPVYHYPAWPTAKAGRDRVPELIRAHWIPRFEAHGVRLVCENDQHTHKRTVPLRAGQPDPAGIVYLGDGAWGVQTRPVLANLPWLATGASRRHGWMLTVHPDGRIAAEAIDADGAVFDQVEVR